MFKSKRGWPIPKCVLGTLLNYRKLELLREGSAASDSLLVPWLLGLVRFRASRGAQEFLSLKPSMKGYNLQAWYPTCWKLELVLDVGVVDSLVRRREEFGLSQTVQGGQEQA